MSSSLKERIISALLVGVLFFMMLCITNKLIDYREDERDVRVYIRASGTVT